MKDFFRRWIINTIAVLAATQIVGGISYEKDDWVGLILATLTLGILNAVIKPFMVLLSFPLLVASLGLFMVIINAVLLKLVDALFPSFHVETFTAAMIGAIVISIVSIILNTLTGGNKARVSVKTSSRRSQRPPRNDGPGGNGPVIDV